MNTLSNIQRCIIQGPVVLLIFLLCAPGRNVSGQEKPRKKSIFRDSTDNAYDMSDWLIKKKGVLIMPTVITEPAVGYGAAVAGIFFHSSYTEKKGPPSMTGILGGGTQNGTWMAGVFHIGYWNKDRLRYSGALLRANINVGFYGSGSSEILSDEPVNLNLNMWALFQQLKGRIAQTDFFIGGKYLLAKSDNKFDIPIDIPEFEGIKFSSTLSEASLLINFDSRDNIFTPSEGFFVQLEGTYSDKWFGGDALYGRIGVDALGYFNVSRNLKVGLRYGSNYTIGDVPFYSRPFVQLRGAPMMKYQNRNTIVMETEGSVDLSKRWSLIGFAGIGNAYSEISKFEAGKSVRTVGTGFRYLVARKLGARMGMDFAASQDDFAFYLVFGSAWMR